MAQKQWRAIALLLLVFALSSFFLTACSRQGTVSSSSSDNTPQAPACAEGSTVKTEATAFGQTCIALKKGSSLKIMQDQVTVHIFDYGQWDGNTAKPETPS